MKTLLQYLGTSAFICKYTSIDFELDFHIQLFKKKD